MGEYFAVYGNIIDSVAMIDKATGKLRGFGFVQFDNTESVELIMLDHEAHQILGQWVDVKKSDGMKGKGKGATAPAFGVAYAAPTFQSCGKGYGGGVVARPYAANFVPTSTCKRLFRRSWCSSTSSKRIWQKF